LHPRTLVLDETIPQGDAECKSSTRPYPHI
jgi:hypothetical protein